MKNIKWSSIFTSLLYIAAGIYLFLFPGTTIRTIGEVLCFASIALGVLRIILYLVRDIRKVLFRNDFVEGFVFIVFGGVLLYNMSEIEQLIPFILVSLILLSGISKIQDGLDASRIGFHHTGVYFFLAIVSLGIGATAIYLLIAEQKMLPMLNSIGLIYSGATDLFSAVYLSTKIRRFFREQAPASDPKRQETVQPLPAVALPAPELPAEPIKEEPETTITEHPEEEKTAE